MSGKNWIQTMNTEEGKIWKICNRPNLQTLDEGVEKREDNTKVSEVIEWLWI